MKKDFLARELTIEVVVGFFVVMVFFGLAYFTFMISGKKWGQEVYKMETVFNDVMGLRVKDNVVVRGMPIGEVKHLILKEDGVHVFLEIRKKLAMRKDYRITIITTSILGGRYLEISEGTSEYGRIPKDFCFTGSDPRDLMRDAAELISEAKKGLVGKDGVIENIREATVEIKNIATRLNKGQGTLGKLFSPDDTLYSDLKSSVASLKTVAERLEKGKGTLGKLMSEDDSVYKDLKSSVSSLKVIAKRLEEGKGMIGKLLSEDESLYNDLRDTVNEARAALDDVRETTPVVTFTSVLFGAF